MTHKDEKNQTPKKVQDPDEAPIYEQYSRDVTPYGKATDLELADVGKVYGVKETLKYAQGLDMENADDPGLNLEFAGELTGDQTKDLKKEIGYQPK